jgi:hypothetical protein
MVNVDEISSSKAIFGAVFMQYFVYAVIYIAEGAKFEQLYGGSGDAGPARNNRKN